MSETIRPNKTPLSAFETNRTARMAFEAAKDEVALDKPQRANSFLAEAALYEGARHNDDFLLTRRVADVMRGLPDVDSDFPPDITIDEATELDTLIRYGYKMAVNDERLLYVTSLRFRAKSSANIAAYLENFGTTEDTIATAQAAASLLQDNNYTRSSRTSAIELAKLIGEEDMIPKKSTIRRLWERAHDMMDI